jgi:hypothetical protein
VKELGSNADLCSDVCLPAKETGVEIIVTVKTLFGFEIHK